MNGETRPKVVVTQRIFDDTRALLEVQAAVQVNLAANPWAREELIERARDASGLMAFMPDWIDADFLAACPKLKVIGAALKGYDNIDAEACREAGVCLTIVPDLLTVPTAELAIGLMLALGRNLVAADRSVREQGFAGWRPTFYGAGLSSATVGIYGFGQVGQAIAARLRAFECALIATDLAIPDESTIAAAGVRWVNHDTLLAESDYLVLALPLTPQTVHLIDRQALAQMKPCARLINPARGSLVDERAVADALDGGHLGGYASDVYECEDWARTPRPATIEPRLRALNAPTVLTPHIGSAVVEVRRQIELSAARSIIDVLSGRTPQYAVTNPTLTSVTFA